MPGTKTIQPADPRNNSRAHSECLRKIARRRRQRNAWIERKENMERKNRVHFDERTRELKEFVVGNAVRVQDPKSKNWSRKGIVIEVGKRRRYKIRDKKGKVFERNRKFLRRFTGRQSTSTTSIRVIVIRRSIRVIAIRRLIFKSQFYVVVIVTGKFRRDSANQSDFLIWKGEGRCVISGRYDDQNTFSNNRMSVDCWRKRSLSKDRHQRFGCLMSRGGIFML